MKMTFMGGLIASSTLIASVAQAEETISAVHAFPETLIYTKSFLSFVDKVNEAGAGVIQIDVRGGPEATSAKVSDRPMAFCRADG